jgi:hypothetical protein
MKTLLGLGFVLAQDGDTDNMPDQPIKEEQNAMD